MDYAGRDFRNIRYPVDRELTEDELAHRYVQSVPVDAIPMDFLSVIKFNSNFIELVDRWYPITGFSVWFGACIASLGIFLSCIIVWAFFWAPAASEPAALWFMLIAFVPITFGFIWIGLFVIRTECGRWTHYPMRLNRKTRQVYVFRQDGTVLNVRWDDLFITLGISKNPMVGTTYDLRAHVLDADGKTVRESFTLGYPSLLGNARSIDRFWAFLQPYMEASDGVGSAYRHLKSCGYLVPVDDRKEGWRWSISRSFMLAAHWPWAQLLFCIPFGLNAAGRMVAMWTSKLPKWPDEVECANEVAMGDPYNLTWRDNAPLGWRELYWPLVCTVLGVGGFIGIIIAMMLTIGS